MPDPVTIAARVLTTEEVETEIDAILKRPYSYVFTPDAAAGGYAAAVLEFPGVFAAGATFDGAHANIRRAAREWLREIFRLGQQVPAPMNPSNRLVPLDHDVHFAAAREAAERGVPVETFVAHVLETHLEPNKALTNAIEVAVAPVLDDLQRLFATRFPQVAASRGSSSGGTILASHYLAIAWPDLDDRLVVGVKVEQGRGHLEVEADVSEEYSGRLHHREPSTTVPRSAAVDLAGAAAARLLKTVSVKAWTRLFQGNVDGPRVHIVHGGFAICGKPGLPGKWSDGSRHVRLEEAALATCDVCVGRAPEIPR